MSRNVTHYIIAFLLFASPVFATLKSAGQKPFIKIDAPTEVATGASFQIVYTLNFDADNFIGPDFKGFELLGGPGYSMSSSTSLVNGKRITETITTYTYALRSLKPGVYNIKAAQAKHKKNIVASKPLTITVASNPQQTEAKGVQDNNEGDIFISNIISNKNPYKGEVIVLTQKLYTRLSISNIGRLKLPSFNGFWSESIHIDNYRVVQENYKGKLYNTIILNSTLLIPQKTGIITIEPSSLDIERVVEKVVNRQVWGATIQQRVREMVENTIRSSSLKIQVREHPTKKQPESFSGAVGKFDISASFSETDVEVGEPIELTISISGNGNLKLISTPEINLPTSLEVFEPEIKDKISISASDGMSGNRKYTFLIIPRETGEVNLQEIVFSFFNPATGQYTEKSIPNLGFNATYSEKKSFSSANMGKEDVKFIAKDIRYIHTKLKKHRNVLSIPPGSPVHIIILALLLLFLVVFLIVFNKYIQIRADVVKLKSQKAKNSALKKLKLSSAYFESKDRNRYYHTVSDSLWGYASDKLGIQVHELSKEKIEDELSNAKISQEAVGLFLKIINTCEYHHYAPTLLNGEEEWIAIHEDAEKCILTIDQQLNN